MKNGFTLVEFLIVIALFATLTAFILPTGVRFLRTQSLDETTNDIVSTLRRAHAQAVFQKNDSAFGVKFLSGSYVLFQGSSYAGRTTAEDESTSLASGISTSGIDEIVFAKLAGTTTAGTLTITLDSNTKTIGVNAQGKTELQ